MTETQKQIGEFFGDLLFMVNVTNGGNINTNYKKLYDKYPKVRICIRRALFNLKQKGLISNGSRSSSRTF